MHSAHRRYILTAPGVVASVSITQRPVLSSPQPVSCMCPCPPPLQVDVKNTRGAHATGKKITSILCHPCLPGRALITSNDSRIRLYNGYMQVGQGWACNGYAYAAACCLLSAAHNGRPCATPSLYVRSTRYMMHHTSMPHALHPPRSPKAPHAPPPCPLACLLTTRFSPPLSGVQVQGPEEQQHTDQGLRVSTRRPDRVRHRRRLGVPLGCEAARRPLRQEPLLRGLPGQP